MKHLSPREIEEILTDEFDFKLKDIFKYSHLFKNQYMNNKVLGTLHFIRNNPSISKTKIHKKNTMLKKTKRNRGLTSQSI